MSHPLPRVRHQGYEAPAYASTEGVRMVSPALHQSRRRDLQGQFVTATDGKILHAAYRFFFIVGFPERSSALHVARKLMVGGFSGSSLQLKNLDQCLGQPSRIFQELKYGSVLCPRDGVYARQELGICRLLGLNPRDYDVECIPEESDPRVERSLWKEHKIRESVRSVYDGDDSVEKWINHVFVGILERYSSYAAPTVALL